MRHFGSLVLALVLAPVVWVAIAFGTNRLARSVLALSGSSDTDKYLGIGLLLVAAIALGVLLVPRISPVGPVIAGAGFLAVSALGLSSGSPVYDLGKDVLSTADQQTLVSPIPTGYLWLAGFLLLVPLVVPARWRKQRGAEPAAAPAAGPYGPGGPQGPGGPGGTAPGSGAPTAYNPTSGAPGTYGSGPGGPNPYEPNPYEPKPYEPSPYGSGPPSPGPYEPGNSPTLVGSPPGSPANADNPPPATPYYSDYNNDRPAQSPGSAQFPSASPYPGSAGAQYPPSTYGSQFPAHDAHQAPNYPANYSAPEPPPGPTSYSPTVYGRSRPDDEPDRPDDPQETRRINP
ncbi:hypothetical protein [Cryptosporangium arvum]|uniref:hypothetical protein n=1 Tax=Cryptosporangium arvum TaxID=80871 RepID=UPI0004B35A03|nr:hypothetical protein [Cryptosporangium arvum]